VSRYDWPSTPDDRRFRAGRGNAGARRAYNLDLNAGFDPAALAEARAIRHAPPPSTARHPDRDLWLPVGPAATLRGGGDGDLRVAGRVRDIAVSPNGERAYAASALGGLWYIDTARARWEPVGAWAVADPANLAASSNTLACGAVYVVFDQTGNDPARDEVWVGTGEPSAVPVTPIDTGVVGQYGGVGVLHALGPVHISRTEPRRDPWGARQAQPRDRAGRNPAYGGLRGAGVFSFAADPTDDHNLVAATTRGLHHTGPGPADDPWAQVIVEEWERIERGASGRVPVTDVAWTPRTAGHHARLWVAVVDTANPALTGVWMSENGVAGPFVRMGRGIIATNVDRLGLAAHPAFPEVVYVLGTGPRVWRIQGTGVHVVQSLPDQLFGRPDQSAYDLALALDPRNADRIIIGGAAASRHTGVSMDAALYRLPMRPITPGLFGPAYRTDYAGGNAADPTWIGAGVHADVHRIRWWRNGEDSHVWVCCDGGIFRSTADAAPGSFASRSTGLGVTETGFIDSHPASDGLVLAGVQDNGAQLRIGDSVWRRVLQNGDAGGVAFDPGASGRFVAQAYGPRWIDDRDAQIHPSDTTSIFDPEVQQSRFYSNAAVGGRAGGATQLAVGTTRVWYSEHMGARPVGGRWRRDWVTLPGGTDPRAADPNDFRTDVLPPGHPPAGSSPSQAPEGVRALRWGGPDRLYVVMRGAIYRLDRTAPTPAGVGTWAPATPIVVRPAPPVVTPPPGAPAPPRWPQASAGVPQEGAWNDLAVDDHGAGPHGSFYVATSHPLEPVWWFDGTSQWHPTRLGTWPTPPPAGEAPPLRQHGVRAPAYAVVVDPDDRGVVYVGTTVGVWRGVLTLEGATPSWEWRPFNSGLPEAAVQDLAISTWPRAGGGPLKLLRAALQARGVWEVEPGVDVAAATYLRVHPYDTRRVTPTSRRDPMWNPRRPEVEWPLDWADRRNRDYRGGRAAPRTAPDGTPAGSYFWHGSPDIRLRPAPAAAPVPLPGGLPWTDAPADSFWLWSLQTALRTIDPLIVPDGRWTEWWRRRLSAIRESLGIDAAGRGTARVDARLWNHARVQEGFWADPWADGGPTEADLIERVVGMATPRGGGPTAAPTSPATLAVLRRPYRVDVCLHHRGRETLPESSFAVVLLRFQLPANPATWATTPAPFAPPAPGAHGAPTPDPINPLRAALAAGALPAGFAFPAGWAAADPAEAVRRPDRPVTTGAPVVVTFEVDFSSAPFSSARASSLWLLMALAHSTADPLALAGADLSGMVLGSRHAGARSVQVVV